MQKRIKVKPALSDPIPRDDDHYAIVVTTSIDIEENYVVTKGLPEEFIVRDNPSEVIIGTVEIEYQQDEPAYLYEIETAVIYSNLEPPPNETKIVVKTEVKDKGESTYHWDRPNRIFKYCE